MNSIAPTQAGICVYNRRLEVAVRPTRGTFSVLQTTNIAMDILCRYIPVALKSPLSILMFSYARRASANHYALPARSSSGSSHLWER
jgi:hypothetical protein